MLEHMNVLHQFVYNIVVIIYMHNINFSISKSNTYIDDYTTMGYHQFTNPFNGSLGSYIVMSGMTT